MIEAQSGGRAFFERQQRRRRDMQARLTGMTPSGQIPESEPTAALPDEPEQAADSEPEPEIWEEAESRAEAESPEEAESRTEASAAPEPESWAEPSALPERERPAEPPGPPEPALQLVVTDGPSVGQTFRLGSDELTIGREEGSDIELDDLTVSHDHALVRRHGEVTTIEDLRSTNGTTVNGAVISRPVRIEPGDLIMVGAVELLVEHYEVGQRQRQSHRFGQQRRHGR
jgi:pSer/pThr/pTyr-binding forkhead associated (FHA) protein